MPGEGKRFPPGKSGNPSGKPKQFDTPASLAKYGKSKTRGGREAVDTLIAIMRGERGPLVLIDSEPAVYPPGSKYDGKDVSGELLRLPPPTRDVLTATVEFLEVIAVAETDGEESEPDLDPEAKAALYALPPPEEKP